MSNHLSDTIGICPYTGLRSFTEEESLYFKGRDSQVDQLTALLEQNRFLMVTGASGEGKSSLIYAGLIPNARAGFFKAKYTNWIVADFRPERSPVTNMARAIAEKFSSQQATAETELRRGFSSLIDLYTNSEFYTDEEDDQWKQLSEIDKKNKKRKAANLLILVDQFEEFFTNPENFFKESPSQDSQIVVNLLLETARIAISRNLPVYIVCTMRSDYIGQCSAFRGLPEYIGFSQFFVPRLKRKDLKQVIEEPAILSGNRISQRLIERLVYDLSEGVDQLPILQHALSQIWLAADNGQREMDLLHYAMVGGMPADELPDQDKVEFNNWFKNLPAHQREYYHETSLSKVIEIHASVLYENASVYYNQHEPASPITQTDAKRIIALTFSCLTKIDNSRAVRNRMSLREITAIVNTPGLTPEVIGGVLNSYREEGSSFIRPFKTSEEATHTLTPETVLDITHESLIRNWTKLNKWANEEYESYATYLDFKKQLDRWKNNGRSSAYLLPIGPLSFFEDWFAKSKPTVGWIKRYSEIQEDETAATAHAAAELADIRAFLAQSARSVMVTRAFIKYGPQRIVTIAAIVIMLIASGFYWNDAEQKTNKKVIERVQNRAQVLLASPEIENNAKAVYLQMNERYSSGSLLEYFKTLPIKERIVRTCSQYRTLLEINKKDKTKLKHDLIQLVGNDLRALQSKGGEHDFLLENVNKFNVLLSYDSYYNPNKEVEETLKQFVEIGYNLVEKFFTDRKLARPSVGTQLNLAMHNWLTFNPSNEGVTRLLTLVSPMSGAEAQANFETYYPKGSYELNGRNAMDFNGGFHTLASLYAAAGDEKQVIRCFEAIISYNQTAYFGNGRMFNNYTTVLGYLYQFGHQAKAPVVVSWLGKNDVEDSPYSIYRNMVIRSAYISRLFGNTIDPDFLRSFKGYYYPNLCLGNRTVFNELVSELNKQLEKFPNPNERNFLLAMNKKRQAIFDWKYAYDRDLEIDQASITKLFDEAIGYYRQVDKNYLSEQTTIIIPYISDGIREKVVTRNQLFIYPDYMDGWFSNTYHSDVFFNYLQKEKLFSELYVSGNDLEMLNWWVAKAFENKPPFFDSDQYDNHCPMPNEVLVQMATLVAQHPATAEFDGTQLAMIISNNFFSVGDTVNANVYGGKFDKSKITQASERYGYIERNFFFNELRNRAVYLARYGKREEAMDLAERFPRENEKAFAYLFMAKTLYEHNADPQTFIYLDSAFSKIQNMDITNLQPQIDPRFDFVRFISQIGSEPMNRMAFKILRDYPVNFKQYVVYHVVDGLAAEGNYYKAYSAIPKTLTDEAELDCLSHILWEVCKKRDHEQGDVTWKKLDEQMWLTKIWAYLQYFQPF